MNPCNYNRDISNLELLLDININISDLGSYNVYRMKAFDVDTRMGNVEIGKDFGRENFRYIIINVIGKIKINYFFHAKYMQMIMTFYEKE